MRGQPRVVCVRAYGGIVGISPSDLDLIGQIGQITLDLEDLRGRPLGRVRIPLSPYQVRQIQRSHLRVVVEDDDGSPHAIYLWQADPARRLVD